MRIWAGYRAGLIAATGALAAAAAVAMAVAAPASAQPAATAPVKSAQFVAVSCASTKWCMAVGFTTDHTNRKHSLASVWHAGRWQIISGTPGTGFQTVNCPSVWHCVVTGIGGFLG